MAKRKKRHGRVDSLLELEPDSIENGLSPDEYLNRDLSWLEFNRRVLHEAEDKRTPLLERVNFLSIFNSNLDEFVMKRVGLLKRHVQAGVLGKRAGGLNAAELLAAIRSKVLSLLEKQAEIFTKKIQPALREHNIHVIGPEDLTGEERKDVDRFFRESVFPVLTPLAVDPGHPFPFMANLSISLAVSLRHPGRDEKQFARLKVPEVLPQMILLRTGETEDGYRFISLVDVICLNLQALFPGMEVLDVMPFRITRNADVTQVLEESDEAEDLLDLVELEVRQRKFEVVVRLEHGASPDPWMLKFLMREMELAPADVYEMPALLDYTTLRPVAELPIRELRCEPWTPLTPPRLMEDDTDIFSVLRSGDLLVHHPYESFAASVERFVKAAAQDPEVLAIKITLYRTGDDSPFINSLIQAAEAGKQVVALVELKARFDEERNIELAQALERAGAHVVYGVVGMKTHTKTALVVRREADGLRCYAHIGTGNYHVQTAKLYTDLGILTCAPEITGELVELFHFLTGRSLKRKYKKLLVAPVNMVERFHRLIEREIKNKEAGKHARIIAKMNSLEDHGICKALYTASQAGVKIDLIVRGICCLRPGVPGLSENIRVTSVIGRFLEHSRIFYFAAGEKNPLHGEYYIGSADWMHRNLFARIELVTPVEDPKAKLHLLEILHVQLKDQRQAWDMQPDGSYVQRKPEEGAKGPRVLGTHKWLMLTAKRASLPDHKLP